MTLPAGSSHGDAWVAACMVSSLDGAVELDGVSAGLGGDADRLALSRLRGAHDVSLVGAGTVRGERYGPLTGSAARRHSRSERGLAPVPRLAIVTGSGALDPSLPVFEDRDQPPLVLTSTVADRRALSRLEDRAEIRVVGEAPLAAPRLLGALVDLGLHRVLCEGGPRLNQGMLAADLLDEVFLTVAPTVVGGPAARIIQGDEPVPRRLRLLSAFEHGGDLLLRYRHVERQPR